jgi:hypothetical protein
VPSRLAANGGDAADVANWPTEDLTLYRRFCKDVSTAEEQWDLSKTSIMASLRNPEPQVCPTFLRCLTVARKATGEDVVYEWRKFQEQGWERRRQHGYGIRPPETTTPAYSPPAADPVRRDVLAAAYREFQETVKAKTNGKARAHKLTTCPRLFTPAVLNPIFLDGPWDPTARKEALRSAPSAWLNGPQRWVSAVMLPVISKPALQGAKSVCSDAWTSDPPCEKAITRVSYEMKSGIFRSRTCYIQSEKGLKL